MKSKTLFYNRAILKKNITRFMPAWMLYTIGVMLIMQTAVSQTSAWALNATLNAMPMLNMCYGVLVAQLLFGDLYQSRMCNALHAMPVTRGALFGSHILAGLLFAVVPNILIAVSVMPYLGSLWFTALLWLGCMCLQYLAFFGIGVLSSLCTGNRLAMVAVFAIIQFFSIVIYGFAETIYLPLMPGVKLNEEIFITFCPIAHMIAHGEYLTFKRVQTGMLMDSKAIYTGPGSDWGYLFVCAAVGVAAIVIALYLYRRRKLESAGDFVAFKWLSPIFSVLFTLCAAEFMAVFGRLFTEGGYIIFLLIGLVIGYFTGRMLLDRTVRVFQKKNFLKTAVLVALMLLSLWAAKADTFGIVRYVPDPADVESICYDRSVYKKVTLVSEQDIANACQMHSYCIANGCEADCGQRHSYVELIYYMKDGRVIHREYYVCANSTAAYYMDQLPAEK